MSIRTELTVRLPNSPGAAAAVCRLLSDARVNIATLGLEPSGQLHLVVDNSTQAAGLLRQQHYHLTERQVIVATISNAPGNLTAMLQLMADAGINVDYAYGGAADGAPSAAIVIGVEDPQRAASAAGV